MKALRWVVGLGTLLIAAGGFTLSFGKLNAIAVAAGYGGQAWIYPTIVEGFITLCTLAAFLRHGQRGAWYPWSVGIAGFAYSLWANSVPESVPVEVSRAVPVICIPLSVHMFIIIAGLVDEASARKAERETLKAEQEYAALTFFDDATVDDFNNDNPAPVSPAVEVEREPEPEPEATPEQVKPARKRRTALASPETYRQLAEAAKTPEKRDEWLKMADAAANN